MGYKRLKSNYREMEEIKVGRKYLVKKHIFSKPMLVIFEIDKVFSDEYPVWEMLNWYGSLDFNEVKYYKEVEEMTQEEKEIAELKVQIKKMKDCLTQWYSQHNEECTETFYYDLLRDTEKLLWADSAN